MADLSRDNLANTVHRFMARHRLVESGDRVLVAVSGGADSVALLALLREVAGRSALHLEVAHLDHGWRADSPEDARFVADLAAPWGIPAMLERVDAPTFGRQRRLSPEAAARELRYAFLARMARERGCARVAVGHTADDQAETLLLRLVRGGAVTGMRASRPLESVALIRPLLDVWRAELRTYLRERGLTWREDPTNADRAHLRNRIRHDLIPALEGYIPDVRARLKDAANRLTAEDAALERATEEAEGAVLRVEADGVRLRREVLAEQPAGIRHRLMQRALLRAGGNNRRLRFVHTEEALRLAAQGRLGQRASLPGVEAEVREEDLLLAPAVRTARASVEYMVPVGGRLDAAAPSVVVETAEEPRSSEDGAAALVSVASRLAAAEAGLLPAAARLDADRVRTPLRLRAWRPGDRFRPLGMRGRKKVGDFLTDLKVPLLRRRRVMVLEDAAGEIVWVVGWRVADGARVRPETRRVLRVRVSPGVAAQESERRSIE